MEQQLSLRNISSETAERLVAIGITSSDLFLKLGAEKTYKLLIESGHEHDQRLLYMLKGAELDIDWHIIAEREQRRAKSRFAEVDEP